MLRWSPCSCARLGPTGGERHRVRLCKYHIKPWTFLLFLLPQFQGLAYTEADIRMGRAPQIPQVAQSHGRGRDSGSFNKLVVKRDQCAGLFCL